MIVQAFYEHLAADAALAALVSSKIFPFVIPQGKDAPAVTYSQQLDSRDQIFSGVGTLRSTIFDVDCYDQQYIDAIAIADAVESALIDFRGQLGTTSPVVTADHVRLERRGPDDFETQTELYRVPLQFFIAYTIG